MQGRVDQSGLLQLSGADLRGKLKQTGPELDGLTYAELRLMPDAFFDQVARFWNALKKHRLPIPESWKDVKVALIPKDALSNRPIGVSALVWRICASATISHLQTWLASWIHPTLFGGLSGCSVDDAINNVICALPRAGSNETEAILLAKMDLTKCFDNASPFMALRVLKHFGLSEEEPHIMAEINDGRRSWVTVEGHSAAEPIVQTS